MSLKLLFIFLKEIVEQHFESPVVYVDRRKKACNIKLANFIDELHFPLCPCGCSVPIVPFTSLALSTTPTPSLSTTPAYITNAVPISPVPTTAYITNVVPTSPVPTTAYITSAVPTTPVPTTPVPTTAYITSAVPTTPVPTTAYITSAVPTTPVPTTDTTPFLSTTPAPITNAVFASTPTFITNAMPTTPATTTNTIPIPSLSITLTPNSNAVPTLPIDSVNHNIVYAFIVVVTLLIASILVNVVYFQAIKKFKKAIQIHEEHSVLCLKQATTFQELLADCKNEKRILLDKLKDHVCKKSDESLYRSSISLP